ncbi:MAG: DNA topoisomerase I [Candidatus Aenigmatarchaeota archaeon]
MTVVMIAEKPMAAKTIAIALADKGSLKATKSDEGVDYYEFKKKGKKHVIVAAVGHLFTLKQTTKGWDYPIFDVDWVPSYKASGPASFTKKYFDVVEKIVPGGKDYIVCCDYDEEGSVIGYNILRFLCKKNDAKRMKFSTMTKEELIESYDKMTKSLDFGQIEAGLTRHYLDYMWGVSLTRALTNAIKNHAKRFRVLSTGRVQGPILHMLTKHEKKISAFKPEPFWQIELEVLIGKQAFKALYEKEKLWDKSRADEITSKAKSKEALVKDIKKKVMSQRPPKPYNTTSFLADVYRFFGFSPQFGMSIAESLYQAGLISYPRTSSEKLPPDINYKKILSNLAKQDRFKIASTLVDKKPEEGSRTDPAHPAIYPTGDAPKKLDDRQRKVYDLVVHRFLACFGDPAKRESQKVILDVNGFVFFLHGTKTIEPGWLSLYGKYAAREEVILPEIKIGDKLKVKNVSQTAKETQPPPRFSQGSVLKEMEAKELGTKATRAQILQILYNRGYLIGKSIEVTELGSQLSDILEKNVPDVVSEKLTRHFEEECDLVENGKIKREKVLDEAKTRIIKICKSFKLKEAKIGKELTEAVIATQDKQSLIGKCPKCGGMLKVHKNWRTGCRFIGCSNFKKGICKFSAPAPREGIITSTEKTCDQCKSPIIEVRNPGRRPFRMCVDLTCPTKKDWLDKSKLKKREPAEKSDKPKTEKKVIK